MQPGGGQPRKSTLAGPVRPPNLPSRALAGRVYVMKLREVENTLNAMTSNFSIKTHPVEVLNNSSATHSFNFAILVET